LEKKFYTQLIKNVTIKEYICNVEEKLKALDIRLNSNSQIEDLRQKYKIL